LKPPAGLVFANPLVVAATSAQEVVVDSNAA